MNKKYIVSNAVREKILHIIYHKTNASATARAQNMSSEVWNATNRQVNNQINDEIDDAEK